MKKLLMSAAFIALVCDAVPANAGSTLAIGGGANLGNVTTLTGAGALGNAAAGQEPVASTPRWVAALPLPRLRGASVRASARRSVSLPVSPVLWPVRMARP